MAEYKYNNQHPQKPYNNEWFTNVFDFEENGLHKKYRNDNKKLNEFNFQSNVNTNLQVDYSDRNNVSITNKSDASKKYNVGKVKFLSTGELLQSITKVETADAVTDKGNGNGNGLKYYEIQGDAGPLHYDPQLKGSLFQAASQFNALEMYSADFIPEQGITIYKDDPTQGPACALACPYATLYRNYFSMPGGKPQKGERDLSDNTSYQINALEEFEKTSGFKLRKENGYFYPNDVEEAKTINEYLSNTENFWNSVNLVKYFIHEDTPVVSAINGSVVQNVAQIYCSALPLAYKRQELNDCPLFIKMILCAIYYATFAQAVLMAQTKGGRVKVLITGVGGGAFGNPPEVIDAAINSALTFFKDYPIDVYRVDFVKTITEFTNATTESEYPGKTGETITPPPSFQIGGAPPSSDSSEADSTPTHLTGLVQVREGNGIWPLPGNKLADGEATKIFAPIKKVIDGILDNDQYKDYYIGLTYSANRGQTSNIFKEYGFTDSQRPSSSSLSTMPPKFTNVQVAKILEHISGSNQANVLKDLYDNGNGELVKNPKYKNFRIIPFSTMEGAVVVPTTGNLGDESDCIKFVDLFLTLPKTIIIGWTSIMGKYTITSNKNKQEKIHNFKDLVIAIGGGVVAGNPDIENIVTKYIDLLITKWDEPSQKFVNNILGINPASSPATPLATPPVTPPVTSSKTKQDVVKVIEGLVNSIKETEDDYTKTLGIKPPSTGDLVYQYPPSDASSPPSSLPKKNLNSAEPTIEDMITAFKAADGGETNFYLGACGSIKAAYDLEMSGIVDSDASAEQAKMRAKLLLNLRKNSLLLKVPTRWDYAEMKMGVDVVPELTGKPIISKDIIPIELNDANKDDIIQKLSNDFTTFKDKSENKEIIIIDPTITLKKIYDNGYITLLNDINYLNFNIRPKSNDVSLIFKLLAYKMINSMGNLLEYFSSSKKAIDNVDEYLKNNINKIIQKINEKLQETTDIDTKVMYSNFYKFLLETKRIDILEYILTIEPNATLFSGIIRPYYEQILEKEKKSIDSMLQSVNYTFKGGYGDGNCFYNSAGMQLIEPKIDYKNYNSLNIFSNQWLSPQYERQTKLRSELSQFLLKIYNKVKDLQEYQQSKLEFIQYLQKHGPQNFDNVSTIKTPIDSYYWGTDDELFYISLLYSCFVVILSPGSQQFQTIEYENPLDIGSIDDKNTFKIISDPTRNNYDAGGLNLALSNNKKPVVFMVGGRGHWDYAIPLTLNQEGGSNNSRANATNNASKSRHNSSFKASSSKSKGKSRNRSHTQRVK